MQNEALIIWVVEYFDTVANEKSLDLYRTESMARADAEKLKSENVITNVLIYPRRVWE
jgi:hypothetical protein